MQPVLLVEIGRRLGYPIESMCRALQGNIQAPDGEYRIPAHLIASREETCKRRFFAASYTKVTAVRLMDNLHQPAQRDCQ
jgi:hypothetical protein